MNVLQIGVNGTVYVSFISKYSVIRYLSQMGLESGEPTVVTCETKSDVPLKLGSPRRHISSTNPGPLGTAWVQGVRRTPVEREL